MNRQTTANAKFLLALLLVLLMSCGGGLSSSPTPAPSYEKGSPNELRGKTTFCVLTDDPSATSKLVLALRELLPGAIFTDSRTDCAAADAVISYNMQRSHGEVFVPPKGAGPSRVLIDALGGSPLENFIASFIEEWKRSNT